MFYWMLKWVLVGPLVKLVFRPYAEGTENVPDEGGAILASNHLSYSDWIFMPLVIPRRVTFVAKAEYFTTPGLKGWLQKTFFSGAGQVPLDRSGGRASEGAIATGLKILNSGELFGIYPEGTRSHDGRLYRGKTGVARMALEAKVPVIPLAVIDTDVVAPPGKVYGSYTRPHVRFGKPLDFSRYEGMESDRYILRSITDEIMYEIMRLSGQEYVDVYAARAKVEAQREAKEASAAAKAEAKEAKEAREAKASRDSTAADATDAAPGDGSVADEVAAVDSASSADDPPSVAIEGVLPGDRNRAGGRPGTSRGTDDGFDEDELGSASA